MAVTLNYENSETIKIIAYTVQKPYIVKISKDHKIYKFEWQL